MSVTAEELARRCDWVAARTRRILQAENRVSPDFFFGRGEGSLLYNLTFNLLAPMMNSGSCKEILFSLIRLEVEDAGYDCVIYASDTWGFEGNERYTALSEEQRHALTDRGFQELQRLGYGKAFEAVHIQGQTPTLGHAVQMRYRRDTFDEDKVILAESLSRPGVMDGGRSKMWGDWKESGMPEAYKHAKRVMVDLRKHGVNLPNATVLVNIATEEP